MKMSLLSSHMRAKFSLSQEMRAGVCIWRVGLDNSLLARFARSFNFLLSKSKTHTFINFCFPFFALISYSEEMQKNLTWTRTRRFLILLLLQQKHSKVEFRDKQIFCSLEYQIKKNLAFPLSIHYDMMWVGCSIVSVNIPYILHAVSSTDNMTVCDRWPTNVHALSLSDIL